jgi:tetratricopeptide (TPR) repeat protein
MVRLYRARQCFADFAGGTRCQHAARLIFASSVEPDPSLARETFAWHKSTLTRFSDPLVMPTAAPPSRDVALETRVFWERFKQPIIAVLSVMVLAAVAFTAYRFYADRRATAASVALASANTAQEYEQVIARYTNTPAAADAYILLAESQRKEKKFTEANKTLETFIAKYPKHEFLSTAKMAMAANLDSMGKTNEALVMYQQIASAYPNSYAAPLAMLSQVYILKSKNRNDDALRICETMLTQYRTSFWANEAMQQLRLLKPITMSPPPPAAAPVPTIPPMLTIPAVPAPQAPPAPNQPQSLPSPKKP